MSPDEQPQEIGLQLHIPEDLLGGVYANFASVWHTAHEFTLDFGALLQVETIEDQAGVPQSVVPVLLTSRVKIPPTVVFEVLRALNDNLTSYEEQWGPITRPGEDAETFPPEDLRPEG